MNVRQLLLITLVLTAALGWRQSSPGERPARVTPYVESPTVAPGTTVRLALEVQLSPELHVQSDQKREGSFPTTLTVGPAAAASDLQVAFPTSKEFRIEGLDELQLVFDSRFIVGVQLSIAKDQPVGPLVVPGRLRYQACNDKLCFTPKTVPVSWTIQIGPPPAASSRQHVDIFSQVDFGRARPMPVATAESLTPSPEAGVTPSGEGELALFDQFEILGTAEYEEAPGFIQFLRDAEAGVKRPGLFEGRGPLAILALVFLGGLALNLTPCVLPMIPINLAIIGAGAKTGRRSRGFLLGATYGGAMALVYGLLGLIVVLTAGTFGTINASPWFNAGIAVLFIGLGLAMFDVVPIDFSRFSSRIQFRQESRGTFLLAFGMGAVAALLAGACVAPVVIQVVVFASDLYAGGSWAALALPFCLGLGMALPWPFAGAGLAALPKPGAWMVHVKHAMGIFILATAAYYGYLAYGLFASRWVDPASVRASVQEKLKAGWHSSLVEGLRVAQRDKTLVLVDFWATWCKNCLVMDKRTLADPAVISALSGYTLIKFQAEDPSATPAKELMQRVGARGLPTYVVLRRKP